MATIRPALAADLDPIVRLSTQLFREDAGTRDPTVDQTWPAEEGAEYFDRLIGADGSCVLVAEHNGMIVGYVAGHRGAVSSISRVPIARLESISVDPAARDSGVGGALAEAFIAWAREHEAAQVRVTAYAANENAVRFYRRLGFAPHELTLEYTLDS